MVNPIVTPAESKAVSLVTSTAKSNILWTGGWDSTFRILHTLIVQKKYVQPYYVVDVGRKSLTKELDAMKSIRKKLRNVYPEAFDLLMETIYTNKDDLVISENEKYYYKRFTDQYPIGSQYLWLSAFSKKYSLGDLELSIDKADYRNTWMEQLMPYMVTDGDRFMLQLKPGFDEKLTLFTNFRFPLLTTDKYKMEQIAREHGFYDILTLSWFCHYPFFGRPCGNCRPCKLAMEGKHQHQHEMPHPLLRFLIKVARLMKVQLMKVFKK